MNLSGPLPIANVQPSNDAGMLVRLNQKFAAEVLQVAGDRVVLSIEGVQIVARLASMDQASQLLERRFAQFLVKDMTDSTVVLQLVPQNLGNAPPSSSQIPVLIPNLLRMAELPVNPSTETIARALVSNNLPVTPQLMTELLNVLGGLEVWGQPEAELATALRAAGLPLTTAGLELARSGIPDVTKLISQLQTQLQALLHGQSSSAPLREAAEDTLRLLQQMVVNWDGDSGAVESGLHLAARILGTPLENKLAHLLRNEHGEISQVGAPGLEVLVRLRQALSQQGDQTITRGLDRLLDAIKLNNYLNIETPPEFGKEHWLRLDFPLSSAAVSGHKEQTNPPDYQAAHLRICCLPDGEGNQVNPANTHFMVTVELSNSEMVQVDVSVINKRLGVNVTTSSETVRGLAESELPSLESDVQKLGYIVHSAHCEVGKPGPDFELDSGNMWKNFGEVSVKV